MVLGIDRQNIGAAIEDMRGGIAAWRLWSLYGLNDVKLRYRRSTLGPFWATLSMAVVILVTGFVLSFLFQSPLERFLPYICISLILWNLLTGMVTEGSSTFIASAELILQVKRPLFTYLWQTLWRNLIVGAHTFLVFFVVAFAFGMFPRLTYLLEVPGLIVFLVNAAWMTVIAAIVSTRYRDMPQIVTNLFTVLFWLTPILYEPHQAVGFMAKVVEYNPLYHVFEVARRPLLLELPTATNWVAAIATAVIGWGFTILLFARTRKRIPYWL
jgi:lipopolysaccharide transport system permease protein